MVIHLSIEVFGPGTDPNHRSHWAFLFHQPENNFGDLYDVQVIDPEKLWYQPVVREAATIRDNHAAGMCGIAVLDAAKRMEAIKIIQNEPAPRDGRRKCQDWTVDTLISLEVEELVEPGTAETWSRRVGMAAEKLAKDCGDDWVGF